MNLNVKNVLAQSQFRKAFYAVVITLTVLFSSGCTVQWVYNQLDWLIPWYVRDYLDLNSEQKKWLKTRVGAHLDWHRRTQLPQYSQLLTEVALLVKSDKLTEPDIVRVSQRVNELGQQIVLATAPDIIHLFEGASDQQLKKLFDKIEDDNREFKETYIDVDAHRQNELEHKEMTRFLKKWLGGLNTDQKKMLDTWANTWRPLKADLHAEQLRWQSDFRSCLAQRRSESFPACMNGLLTAGDNYYSADYKQKYEYNIQLTNRLWIDINKSLTSKQREHAVDMLHDLALECDALARQVEE